jgi:hypothetical protein
MPVVQALFGMADNTRDNGSCEVRRLMTKLNLALSPVVFLPITTSSSLLYPDFGNAYHLC